MLKVIIKHIKKEFAQELEKLRLKKSCELGDSVLLQHLCDIL